MNKEKIKYVSARGVIMNAIPCVYYDRDKKDWCCGLFMGYSPAPDGNGINPHQGVVLGVYDNEFGYHQTVSTTTELKLNEIPRKGSTFVRLQKLQKERELKSTSAEPQNKIELDEKEYTADDWRNR